jgi:hypothetical protein
MQHCLFARIRLDVFPIGAQAIAELDVAHPLAVGALVAHGVPGAFADRFAFPLADRRHNVQHQAPSGRAGVKRFRNRNQCDATSLEALQQRA